MFIATFYFLGLSCCILAMLVCLSKGRVACKRVEVDLDALRAASICLSAGRRRGSDDGGATTNGEPTLDEKNKWQDMKAVWMKWYVQCQEKAIMRRTAMYSWVRTLALCAALCLIGVVLEVEFGQSISLDHVLDGVIP